MAVYTDVSVEDLDAFLAGYDIGKLLSYKGIAEGVQNSNFLLHTDAGYFILTLYERLVAVEDLPFFVGLMEHLAMRGINCPQPVRMRDGTTLGQLCGRAAAIVTFLDGVWMRRVEARHCAAVGEALAKLHLAGADFKGHRANALVGHASCGRYSSPAPTASTPSSPACWRRSATNSIFWNAPGRAVCPKA